MVELWAATGICQTFTATEWFNQQQAFNLAFRRINGKAHGSWLSRVLQLSQAFCWGAEGCILNTWGVLPGIFQHKIRSCSHVKVWSLQELQLSCFKVSKWLEDGADAAEAWLSHHPALPWLRNQLGHAARPAGPASPASKEGPTTCCLRIEMLIRS